MTMSAAPVPPSFCPQYQSGSALVISLVLLLLLMLVAVSGVSDSIVQERMAHNAKQINGSFQAAETGMRYVEHQVRSNTLVLPLSRCAAQTCEVPVAVLTSSDPGPPGPEWSRVPTAVVGDDMQVWYRVVRVGDSRLAVNQAPGAASTLYRVSVLSQRRSTRTLLEGVYAFTRI